MYQEEVDLVSNYTKNLLREILEDAGAELGQAQLSYQLVTGLV